MADCTPIRNHIEAGRRRAASEMLPLVYGELRKLAAARLAHENPNRQTLDATALVREAYLRLGGERSFATRSDYLRAASGAMRRILVDQDVVEAWDLRGDCYLRKGEFAKAAEDYSQAIKLKPGRWEAWSGRAFASFHRQQ